VFVVEGYGSSELTCIAAGTNPHVFDKDNVGAPASAAEIRLVSLPEMSYLVTDTEHGDTPVLGRGEVCVRGVCVMRGYYREPERTAEVLSADGWYRTGDVGWLEPDGWVHLTDRCKEMIKVSGFQVAPAELEAVLHGHPAVLDCAVFGVSDERSGEVPVAAVQLEPGADVGPEELQRLVGEALATYKRLHRVVIVDAIPRTPSGKVLRRTLRDEWNERGLATRVG